MCFRLVYGDSEYHLSLPFDSHIEERLYQLMSQGDWSQKNAECDRKVLSRRIVAVITASLEGELLPPTQKQMKYAMAIARELSLELPADVIQYREAMTVFIGTHAERYRHLKANSKKTGELSS